jgi:hypothetical protein
MGAVVYGDSSMGWLGVRGKAVDSIGSGTFIGSTCIDNGSLSYRGYKGTAAEGLRLYFIIIEDYYIPIVEELRLREKVCPTAANINLTKPQLLNKEGGKVACCAATNISAKVTP